MQTLYGFFAVIIGTFNAIGIAAALFVIDPTISQAGVIALGIRWLYCWILYCSKKGQMIMLESILSSFILRLVLFPLLFPVIGKVFDHE